MVTADRALDLARFEEINEAEVKVPWQQRMTLIQDVFPSTAYLDWKKLFDQDPGILGDLVNDIIKADQAEPGRPGKRAAVEPGVAKDRLRMMMGEDYALDPFPEAFKRLVGGRSLRHVAAKTNLHRNTVMRYLQGKLLPNVEQLEAIAEAFGKDPSYFLEYRIAWITALVKWRLQSQPESTVLFYRKIRKLGKYGDIDGRR